MSYINKYIDAFKESFQIDEKTAVKLEYQSITAWDSVGHMVLMATLEEAFDIMLEMDDIINFSSFEEGKNILKKYEVRL